MIMYRVFSNGVYKGGSYVVRTGADEIAAEIRAKDPEAKIEIKKTSTGLNQAGEILKKWY